MVREGEGGIDRESEAIFVKLDAEAPKIDSATLMPNTVLAGTAFSVSASGDSGNTVEVKVGGEEAVKMPEGIIGDDGKSTYQATVNAPTQPGSFTVQITIKDSTGNSSTHNLTLTVQSTGMPVVSGVKAQPSERDIVVSWSPVHDAAQYRIYFGDSSEDLESHIDTGSNASSAKLTGLKSSQTYYFAVSALDSQNQESISRSEVVSAASKGSVFGVVLNPVINGAEIKWSIPSNISASRFSIQYGVQPGMYTEQRVISGTSSSYDFVDLINGVTYYVLLSVVKANGEVINDTVESIVVPGQGGNSGFHFSAQESAIPAMGGPGLGKLNISAQSNLNGPVGMPQSGGVSVIWTFVLVTMGYIFFSVTKKLLARKKLLATIVTNYDHGIRLR